MPGHLAQPGICTTGVSLLMTDLPLIKQQKPRGRPFPKGVSGNPAGRPRFCRDKTTRAAEMLLDG
jgi:hypothetical protein